jgi:gas vesicle protein
MTTKKKTVRVFAVGSSVAAAAGFLAGVLTAPKSGKEIRGDIKKASDRSRQEAEGELKQLNSDLNKVIKQAGNKKTAISGRAEGELKNLVDKGEGANAKVREILSAIHEGDAQDQDLKRAIKSANNALEHLKDYLSK